MLCLKCEGYIADKSKVTTNIVDVLRYMDLLKHHEDSAQKDSKLRMMKRHLNSNNRVLKDLNAILNNDCQTCDRRGQALHSHDRAPAVDNNIILICTSISWKNNSSITNLITSTNTIMIILRKPVQGRPVTINVIGTINA